MTFSIIAHCPHTGMFGAAAATAVPAVGKLVTHAFPGIGAVATQAHVNPYLGICGLDFLKEDQTAGQVVERLLGMDSQKDWRQFAVLDRWRSAVAHTGKECLPWAGHRTGPDYSVQGNRLAGEKVLRAMEQSLHDTRGDSLPTRFINVLEAAADAGGDQQGESSATLFIVDTELYPLWDIRVDHHRHPIRELRRLFELFREKVVPHIERMPTLKEPTRGDVDI